MSEIPAGSGGPRIEWVEDGAHEGRPSAACRRAAASRGGCDETWEVASSRTTPDQVLRELERVRLYVDAVDHAVRGQMGIARVIAARAERIPRAPVVEKSSEWVEPCPRCGADVGERCRGTGHVHGWHVERWNLVPEGVRSVVLGLHKARLEAERVVIVIPGEVLEDLKVGDLVAYDSPSWGPCRGRVLGDERGPTTTVDDDPAVLVQDLSPAGAREYWPIAKIRKVPGSPS